MYLKHYRVEHDIRTTTNKTITTPLCPPQLAGNRLKQLWPRIYFVFLPMLACSRLNELLWLDKAALSITSVGFRLSHSIPCTCLYVIDKLKLTQSLFYLHCSWSLFHALLEYLP